MATLHVADIPDELYEKLRRRAEREQRSLSAEVVTLLERAVEEPRPPVAELLERIRLNRFKYPEGTEIPDSVVLLREDRSRLYESVQEDRIWAEQECLTI